MACAFALRLIAGSSQQEIGLLRKRRLRERI
jgi:hypothetical protein